MRKHADDFTKFLTPQSYIYYILTPTFCYQLTYPRTNRIRKRWLVKRALEGCLLLFVQLYILLEFTYPILQQAPAVFMKKELNIFEVFAYVS